MTATAGLGLKLDHLDEAFACEAAGLWFEVHAENYMVDGGPRLAALAGATVVTVAMLARANSAAAEAIELPVFRFMGTSPR